MRWSVILAGAILILAGCERQKGPTEPPVLTGRPTGPSTGVRNGVQFTFNPSRLVFAQHDTLTATLTVLNLNPDTVTVTSAVLPNIFSWSLKNQDGKTIVAGPTGAIPQIIIMYMLAPDASRVINNIWQPLGTIPGAPIPAGTYELQAERAVDSLSFSVEIEIAGG